MARRRTVDLLPEIFRTGTNRQFLAATLDQLTQEPQVKRTQGWIGRRVGPGVSSADNYVTEPTATRSNYQLEPGVIFLRPDTNTVEDAVTYPGIIDALNLRGSPTATQDRLFESEYYAFDPFCDFDKLVNYSQYYWVPNGPDSVDVFNSEVALTDDFDVTRTATAYQFSQIAGDNPIITLVRGGNYRFTVNQPGHAFWIQSAPGVNGRIPSTPNISSRDVLGVSNNGEDGGDVLFDVPLRSAQDFYYTMPSVGPVDLITDLRFDEINNIYVDTFLSVFRNGIDGITDLDGRTIVFTNQLNTGWEITTQFDPLPRNDTFTGLEGSYDSTEYDQTTAITSFEERYSVWRIQYIFDDPARPFMRLSPAFPVPQYSKFTVLFGDQWSSTQWYKDASGYFEQIPLLTAAQDVLYYQDGTNPEIFGQIRLIDQDQAQPLDLSDIIGAKTYTSPNGVKFTNGLKVQFRGLVEPAQFQNLEFYVEGVGTGPGIGERVGFVDGQAYYGPWHLQGTQKVTGPRADEPVFRQYIYDSVAESLANIGRGGPENAPLPTEPQQGATLGNGIRLIPVSEMVTPETYTRSRTIAYDATPYDSDPYDAGLNAPEVPDYITINRGSRDRNAWSRSNRWFHIDVLRYTAELNNNSSVAYDNNARGRRPIIEFRADMDLFQSGSQGKNPVDVIDFQETDALSNINGQPPGDVPSIDGFNLIQNSRVIFAADVDPQVRNKIYRVDIITPDSISPLISQPIINLVAAEDSDALIGQMTVCLSGSTLQGKSFYFDGNQWTEAQEKTGVNQAPLFDVFDGFGRSFGDTNFYPSTTFRGSRLFGYAVGGTSRSDEVLGFALKYRTLNNVGDILFDNYFYTDTFGYVQDSVGQQQAISTGFARQYIDRVTFSDLLGWQAAAQENRSRQTFRFIYDGSPLIFDVPIDQDSVFNPVQLFVQGAYIDPDRYSVTVVGQNTIITLSDALPTGTTIEAEIISGVPSSVGFYQVPLNLENNALNENTSEFTLGSLRNHYESIAQNLRNIQGPINGSNNTRDLGNILVYGSDIVQNSSPMTLGGVFLRQPMLEIFDSLRFNSQEYEKYKARMIDLASKGDFINLTPSQILDAAVQEIGAGRSNESPFYWSDMLPSNETYQQFDYAITPISTNVFDLTRVYDFTASNFQSVLVYLNGDILTKGYDYSVGTDSATITVTRSLAVGDVLTVREYASTFGSFVPNTPTKMGLYPAYRPEMYLDETAVNPTMVIRGHDGSITRAYGDIRDQILLEFEIRIFNNLKITDPVPLTQDEVVPGQFRETDYSLQEINQILATDFLSYVGWNKLDYVTQQYQANNEFTYNYSQSSDKLDQQPLLGAWRGIYQYFYDTTSPNTRPWEMLGFSQQPSWWQDTYGPAPYTSGNMVLWEDLAAGLVNDPAGPYVLPRFQRPGLTRAVPSGSEGALLSPLESVVGRYDATSFRRSWTFGDGGPVEASWRASSSWPFAVMRLLALTRPAKFFSLFADRDRYRYDSALAQYLWDGRYRLDAKNIDPVYGDGVSRASYLNWIIDYNRQLGRNSTVDLERLLKNLDVRLCWRMAGFSDKKYLKIRAERSTPDGANASLLLPDESYQLLLYKNVPFEQNTYSSVIVQRTQDGWAVLGYNVATPFFPILISRARGQTVTLTSGGTTVRVPTEYSDQVARIPYGYVFTSRAAVCDFLFSYGELLNRQGWQFETQENGYIMDWRQMAQEFLYWSTQGWIVGSLINLNPGANVAKITRPGAVADSIRTMNPQDIVLNQNRQPIPLSNLVIERLENTFTASTVSSDTLNFLNLRFTAYEHIIVFDNRSIFSDLIYQPSTGARQSRLLVSGVLSADWNGEVNAPGFVLNQNNITEWRSNQKYSKGEIVLFKDDYWTATTIIQPSEQFDFNLWLRSDYDEIQRGLLPNAAGDSDQLATAYSVYDANLEQEVDLFSYGLIGFRPREYMAALNLDDVSQVNLYQQFLGTKGTRRSAELFTLADLGKEEAEYNIYEYWAMLRGTYGANANRSYFELLLDEAKLSSDPSLIQVILPGQASEADQTVLLQNVWKQSYKLTSPDILPTLSETNTDGALPSAGYVNIEDADISVFSLENRDAIAENLETLGVGTTIWVASVNPYDWNIYRCESLPVDPITICDNLDGQSLLTFTGQHGLAVGDTLIVKYFDPLVDGVYVVRAVPNLQAVIIDYVFTGNQTEISGVGIAFRLSSARVASPNKVAELSYSRQLTAGAKVWVDNDGTGRWEVIEKTEPFQILPPLAIERPVNNSRYGCSVSQGFQNLTALIGAPADGATGTVYSWIKQPDNSYVENLPLVLPVANLQGYGCSLDIGDQSWAVIGANASNGGRGYASMVFTEPGSNVLEQTQVLIPFDEYGNVIEFGTSVTISQDERWAYVGAPDANRVYAYARVDIQTQSVTYNTNGVQQQFQWNADIVANSALPSQLVVFLDNQSIPAYDASIPNQGITFVTSGNVGNVVVDTGNLVLRDSSGNVVISDDATLTISRRRIAVLDQDLYVDVAGNVSAGIGAGALFTVSVQRGVYSASVTNGGGDYADGDIITIDGSEIGGGGNLIIEVTQTGNVYTTRQDVVSGTNTIIVNSVDGLDLTQELIKIPGTGAGELATGTKITGINTAQLTGTLVVNNDPDETVTVRTTNNISDIGNAAPLIVDQYIMQSGDRVLVLSQNDLSTNGIYQVVSPGTGNNGSWTKVSGSSASMDNKVIEVVGVPPPRTPVGNPVYINTQWRLNNINEITVDLNNTTSGPLSFFASPGPITEITFTGSGIDNTDEFNLSSLFYTVDSIDSFSVKVNDELYRPWLDYTFDSNTGNLTFESAVNPPAGATIQIESRSYFASRPEFVIDAALISEVMPTSFDADARFGASISTTTDGRQFMIGAPGVDVTVTEGSTSVTLDQAGAVYVFDRNVQRFIWNAQNSTQEFVSDLSLIAPVAVKLNGRFLLNADSNINGGFTVSGDTVTILETLEVGDVIEIESNNFEFLQRIQADTPGYQSRFGLKIDQCVDDCSLYMAAPDDSNILIQAGSVDYWNNKARVYGIIASNTANPLLPTDSSVTSGDKIRVNNIFVQITDPRDWNLGPVTGDVWPRGTFVKDSTDVYQATADAPDTVALTDRRYWSPSSMMAVLAQDINDSVPNVVARSTTNLELTGDGVTQTFSVQNIYSVAAQPVTALVYVDNVRTAVTYNNSRQEITFATAPVAGSRIRVISGRIDITVKNFAATQPLNRLSVLPGTGTLFYDLGINVYAWQQTIVSPVTQVFARFGAGLFISDNTTTLVVGAPGGSMIRPMTFDRGRTTFDARSTVFADPVPQSGAVYTYDSLTSINPTVDSPGQFVFGQQIINDSVRPLDQFGFSVDYTTGTLLIGAPLNDRDVPNSNQGQVFQLNNPNQLPAWLPRRIQTPVVDISLLNSSFIYDLFTGSVNQYLDFFDPLQGRMLGAIAQNLNYTGSVDPAAYNVGLINNYGRRWAQEHVGEIWWDTTRVRFIDPNQGDPVYASRLWGQIFPGSQVEIYQWTASDVPPAQYTGPGIPRGIDSYSIISEVDEQGLFVTRYFFWTTGSREVNRAAKKTLSVDTLRRYIENPRASGISYIAPVASGTIAIYNSAEYISSQDTVLHIEFDRQLTTDAVHVEYQLIPRDRADGFLDAGLYRKFVDSLVGNDSAGNAVPDPLLPPSELYGVDFRPRQSMFANRFLALRNYLGRTNEILSTIPAAENRIFNLLNSSEPEPNSAAFYQYLRETITVAADTSVINVDVATDLILPTRSTILINNTVVDSEDYTFVPAPSDSTDIEFDPAISNTSTVVIEIFVSEWNKRLADFQELGYQDLSAVPEGYRYLVASDSTNNGLWTIYEKRQDELVLVRVQNYDTRKYWDFVDWYQPGYDPLTRILTTVPNVSALETITVPNGSSVKVLANAQGKWEIYVYQNNAWDRVALQDGTIQFSAVLWDYAVGRFGFDSEVFDAQYYDQEPVIETRKIIEAINQEIMVGELLIERNRLLMLMFDYILSEQVAPPWLIKTSLIDVDHVIRQLEPFQIYRTDNQDFVLNYINEVKPYHVQIREFNLVYRGNDTYQGNATDFDLPAYWDPAQNRFVSPILDNTGRLSPTSSVPSTSPVWQTFPWNQWYENYTLSIESVTVTAGGQGYTVAPEVIVTGECTRPAVMTAKINSAGAVFAIEVVNPGQGYTTTAVITIVGGNGSGARASAVMDNNLVRSFVTTIKYDRVSYQTDILEWQPNVIYVKGDQVRYDDLIWEAIPSESFQSQTFDFSQWKIVPAGDLLAVDRIEEFYSPSSTMPGRDLSLLMTGIDYPGVQVKGVDFGDSVIYSSIDPQISTYSFNSLNLIYENVVPVNDRLVVTINDIIQTINVDYTANFQTRVITFLRSLVGVNVIKISAADPFPYIGDVIYESSFDDIFLGTRATDINVDGGAFVDTYESHAPEELVPGRTFDALDLRVFTTPGSDWTLDGHGFPETVLGYEYTGSSLSFEDASLYPAVIMVTNQTRGLRMYPDVNYIVDWVGQSISIISGANVDDRIVIEVFELGGGNQLWRNLYRGVPDFQSAIIPVPESQIESVAVFVNGRSITGSVISSSDSLSSTITFPNTYGITDSVVITVFGASDNGHVYSWSVPVVQYFISTGGLSYTLANNLSGTNPANIIVERNGRRVRPAEGIEYISDGTTVVYELPTRGAYPPEDVISSDVEVYAGNTRLIPTVDYVLDPWDGSTDYRTVTLTDAPQDGVKILISVSTGSPYVITGNQLSFKSTGGVIPLPGDIIAVTTWNDTQQQDLLTQVFVGPTDTTLGVIGVTENYDETNFDVGDIINAPGSFDYSTGLVIKTNRFDTGRIITDAGRLTVTLNGSYLFENQGFTVEGTEVIVAGPPIGGTAVVAITSPTQSVLPGEEGFRIFQDMQGTQRSYRITRQSSTVLTAPLSALGDIIQVLDASRLTEPNLTQGIFGQITINGERILYRSRDTENNTLSGLRRGAAGTAAANHAAGSSVYDIGLGNLLPEQYQDRIIKFTAMGNDLITTFTADELIINNTVSVSIGGTVEISVDSVPVPLNRLTVSSFEPVAWNLDFVPTANSVVTLQVTQFNGNVDIRNFTADGFSSRYVSNVDVSMQQQSSQDYLILALDPVEILTAGTPLAGSIVQIETLVPEPNNLPVFLVADGVQNRFVTDLDLSRPITVKVGSIVQDPDSYSVTGTDPVTVVFDTAPPEGLEVEISIVQGKSWYQPGINTASDGVPLQEANTQAARFIRGEQ